MRYYRIFYFQLIYEQLDDRIEQEQDISKAKQSAKYGKFPAWYLENDLNSKGYTDTT